MEKKKSTFTPDFCAVNLPNSPWIVQPFEKHEEVRIEDLKKNIPNKKGQNKSGPFYNKILILSYNEAYYARCRYYPNRRANIVFLYRF